MLVKIQCQGLLQILRKVNTQMSMGVCRLVTHVLCDACVVHDPHQTGTVVAH